MKTKTLYRNIAVRAEDVNEESRTIDLSFSSESPVERWFGNEVLDHKRNSVDLSRLNDGAPLLYNHNSNQYIGVVERAKLSEKRGLATVRFSKSELGEKILQDVRDGILKNISFGYRINKMVMESESEEGATYRATDWMPFEISVVTVPADNSVGIGRSFEDMDIEVEMPEVERSEPSEGYFDILEKKIVLLEKSIK